MNNRNVLLTELEAGSLRSRPWQVPCLVSASTWFTEGIFPLCPHVVEEERVYWGLF